jgi:GntR family transcriptional regulator
VTPDARWQTIYEDLRDQIERDVLTPGSRVPTEPELVEQYGVSRGTVRRALSELEQAGLVASSGPGRGGRTVRNRIRIEFSMSKFELGAYTDDPTAGRDQWKQGVEAAGWVPRQVVDGVEVLPAPKKVAEWLQIPIGQDVVRRRRLRYVSNPDQGIDWVLAMIADTWTPYDIAEMTVDGVAPLLSPDDVTLPGGIYHALGFRQVQFLDFIEAEMPTDEEVTVMGLLPGTPVGRHARVGVDQSGRRVRVLVQIWAGDKQVITYQMPVPERRLPPSSPTSTGSER